MKTIKVNANGDRVLDSGYFVYLFNIDAVMQTCEQTMKQQLSELQYDQTKGIEYFNNVFLGEPNFQLFESQARNQLQLVDGVVRVDSLTYSQVDNTLSYTAVIKTIYGSGEINGII